MSKLKGRIGESCERVGEGLGKVCGRDVRANLVRCERVREGRVRNEMRSMTAPGTIVAAVVAKANRKKPGACMLRLRSLQGSRHPCRTCKHMAPRINDI